MFYIHQNLCISPQQSFKDVDLNTSVEFVDNKLMCKEPSYEGIPLAMLRRMGKAVRIGVGSALPLVQNSIKPHGIIIGTSNGGMEDCIKFLNQIIDYKEGTLTPTNFVQSTANAIAGQIGMLSSNHCYNITHVHRGLAFENAMLDAAMRLNEYPEETYLLGGVDEISAYNYNIELLADTYKSETVSVNTLFSSQTPGTIAGEGASMFIVNKTKENAFAHLKAINIIHTSDESILIEKLQAFLETNLAKGEKISLFLSGENGDSRQTKFITGLESILSEETPIARFKHLTGEYPTASSFSLWLATRILATQKLPINTIKKAGQASDFSKVLIYNHYKDRQHSFMLLERI